MKIKWQKVKNNRRRSSGLHDCNISVLGRASSSDPSEESQESQEEFLRNKTYPKGILKDREKKCNFRKACKNFRIVNGDLMY